MWILDEIIIIKENVKKYIVKVCYIKIFGLFVYFGLKWICYLFCILEKLEKLKFVIWVVVFKKNMNINRGYGLL